MTIAKIWVVAEIVDGAPTTTSLELITRARTLADTVEAVVWGDGAAAAGALGEYGATTVHDVGDLDGGVIGHLIGWADDEFFEGEAAVHDGGVGGGCPICSGHG